MANAEMETALDVARRYQDDLVRTAEPVPMPKEVSQEEKDTFQKQIGVTRAVLRRAVKTLARSWR